MIYIANQAVGFGLGMMVAVGSIADDMIGAASFQFPQRILAAGVWHCLNFAVWHVLSAGFSANIATELARFFLSVPHFSLGANSVAPRCRPNRSRRPVAVALSTEAVSCSLWPSTRLVRLGLSVLPFSSINCSIALFLLYYLFIIIIYLLYMKPMHNELKTLTNVTK